MLTHFDTIQTNVTDSQQDRQTPHNGIGQLQSRHKNPCEIFNIVDLCICLRVLSFHPCNMDKKTIQFNSKDNSIQWGVSRGNKNVGCGT